MNDRFSSILGNTAPIYPPGPATDLSSVPPAPTVPLVPSYQEAKPATAWNDPPPVLLRATKPTPKVKLFRRMTSLHRVDYRLRLRQRMVLDQIHQHFSHQPQFLLNQQHPRRFILIQL